MDFFLKFCHPQGLDEIGQGSPMKHPFIHFPAPFQKRAGRLEGNKRQRLSNFPYLRKASIESMALRQSSFFFFQSAQTFMASARIRDFFLRRPGNGMDIPGLGVPHTFKSSSVRRWITGFHALGTRILSPLKSSSRLRGFFDGQDSIPHHMTPTRWIPRRCKCHREARTHRHNENKSRPPRDAPRPCINRPKPPGPGSFRYSKPDLGGGLHNVIFNRLRAFGVGERIDPEGKGGDLASHWSWQRCA